MNKLSDIKHQKYAQFHQPNDILYGCGIENETYFIFDKFVEVTGEQIKNNTKKERYSLDYYKNFKTRELNKFYNFINDDDTFMIPIYINSHALEKCDKFDEHKTIYSNLPQQLNDKFSESIFDIMLKNKIIKKMYKREFCFDGDSIEFMTINFYKNTVEKCVEELKQSKKIILDETTKIFEENQIFNNYGKLCYQDYNYGFAKYMTNLSNIMVCNSGTYHINITLPTELNQDRQIKDMDNFIIIHQNAIRAIQWIEPLFLACYGSSDIFSINNDKFAKGSQRCALSRYVSIGTYSSQKMPKGKLLDTFNYSLNYKLWYNKYHNNSGYQIPETIGYDINFNKFNNHGIEIRFFDYFSENYLVDVMNIIVLLCEFSLNNKLKDHSNSTIWNNTVVNCMRNGSDAKLDRKYIKKLNKIFHIKLKDNLDTNPWALFQTLVNILYEKYHDGNFVKLISPDMKNPLIINFNKMSVDIHKVMLKNSIEFNNNQNSFLGKVSDFFKNLTF